MKRLKTEQPENPCAVLKLRLASVGAQLVVKAYPETRDEIFQIIDRQITATDIEEFVAEVEQSDKNRVLREQEAKKPLIPMFESKEHFAEHFLNLWDALDDQRRNSLGELGDLYARKDKAA